MLIAAAAAALFCRRTYPVSVVAVVAAIEVAVTLMHPWGSNVSAGPWFSLYAVGTARTRCFALATLAAATVPLAQVYETGLVVPRNPDY